SQSTPATQIIPSNISNKSASISATTTILNNTITKSSGSASTSALGTNSGATSTTSSTPLPTPTNNPNDNVIVAYWAYWRRGFLAENNLPWTEITHLNFAFALVDETFALNFSSENQLILGAMVSYAHANNVNISIAIGGWTGSQYFSTLASSSSSRAKFINSTVSFVNQFKLDGVDIDWEYPGRKGMACNAISPNDTNNFLALITELRAALGNDKLLTLAVRGETFDGPDRPISDVSAFAKLVDWVNVMAYDVSVDDGSGAEWTKLTGPNAPFDVPGTTTNQVSFKNAVSNWLNAGMPASKMVMGIEFLGRAQKALAPMSSSQYVPRDPVVPQGDQSDQLWADPCPNSKPAYSGIWSWYGLREQGILTCTLNTTDEGWVRNFDNTTQTPWLYNQGTGIYISYDDPQSIYMKIVYIRQQGLRGVMVWDLTEDNGHELLDVVQVIRKESLGGAPSNDCSGGNVSGNNVGGNASGKDGGGLALSVGAIAAITLGLAAFFSLLSFVVQWLKIRASETVNLHDDGGAMDMDEKDGG
ncbi:4163_t:CDS:2, partial [Acaulospora colombiana]